MSDITHSRQGKAGSCEILDLSLDLFGRTFPYLCSMAGVGDSKSC